MHNGDDSPQIPSREKEIRMSEINKCSHGLHSEKLCGTCILESEISRLKSIIESQRILRLRAEKVIEESLKAHNKFSDHFIGEEDSCQLADPTIPFEKCKCTCGLRPVMDNLKETLKIMRNHA